MKTILCNSNTFIKSQPVVKSEQNGPAYTVVTIKIETLHCLEVERDNANWPAFARLKGALYENVPHE